MPPPFSIAKLIIGLIITVLTAVVVVTALNPDPTGPLSSDLRILAGLIGGLGGAASAVWASRG